MAEHHHKYTGILLLLFAVLVLVGAIFFTIAQGKVTNLPEYDQGNEKLKNAKNNLLVAYILGYVAAGMGIVLAILYFGHIHWGVGTEIPHLIVFILLFLLVIVSGIFGLVALNNVNNANVANKNGITNWIWASEIVGLVGLIILIISGAWRAGYVATKKSSSSSMTADNDQTEMTFTAPTTTNDYSQPGRVAPEVAYNNTTSYLSSPVPLTGNGVATSNYVV